MPASWLSVVLFIGLVAPGFYYEIQRSKRLARADESAFQELSRTLLSSVLFAFPAALVSVGAWWLVTGFALPDFAALINRDADYLGAHAGSAMFAIAIYLATSLGLVWLWHWTITLDGSRRLTSNQSIWSQTLELDTPKNLVAGAHITLQSGAVWFGRVGRFSANHELVDRELVLHEPIMFASSGSVQLSPRPLSSVVIKGSEVSSMAIQYFTWDGVRPLVPDRTKLFRRRVMVIGGMAVTLFAAAALVVPGRYSGLLFFLIALCAAVYSISLYVKGDV